MESSLDIGWLPLEIELSAGEITLSTLPTFDAAKSEVEAHAPIDRSWIYAPARPGRFPPSRVFGLPKTHRLRHASCGDTKQLEFTTWVLGFIFGMRLTWTDAGFLDATPVRIGMLTDFHVASGDRQRALEVSDLFWRRNSGEPAELWAAAVHALMLSRGPTLLEFEEFIYLYGALDTCFALATKLRGHPKGRTTHAGRVAWMCAEFEMPVPAWASLSDGRSLVSELRNAAIHESRYAKQPLGFAIATAGSDVSVTLQMRNMVCRLLVALLGDVGCEYVRSPSDGRDIHAWTPS